MILADTSVWVKFFRRGMPEFALALEEGLILIHPVVLGELAVGNLSPRAQTLSALNNLPHAKVATAEECLGFLEMHKLHGRGIGWNDLQLLVAAHLSQVPLWSLDTRLNAAAVQLGIEYHAGEGE